MWEIKATDEYQRRLKHYQKKHPRELAAFLNNLDTYHKALSGGTKPKQVQFGFVHAEPFDVVAIDQKRGGALSRSNAALRLSGCHAEDLVPDHAGRQEIPAG